MRAAIGGLLVCLALASQAGAATTVWVSAPPQFVSGGDPALSGAGRFVAFSADGGQVVVKDMRTGRKQIASVDSRGKRGNWQSWGAEISPDGRFVAFCSFASNLVKGDRLEFDYGADGREPKPRYLDAFVHDRRTGKTIRASIGRGGRQPNNASCAYPNGYDTQVDVSTDGRFVAFTSWATNLIRHDTNNQGDVFVRDTLRGRTTRVSVSSRERQANGESVGATITPDGRFVFFSSWASNLVRGDRDGGGDVFVRDLARGRTMRVSLTSSEQELPGQSGGPVAASADGRFVAFASLTPEPDPPGSLRPDIYLEDRRTSVLTLVSQPLYASEGSAGSYQADISADGRFVVWWSAAPNLVPGDELISTDDDIFLYDRVTKKTRIVSVRNDGMNALGFAMSPSISDDGRFVAWEADQPYVPADTNGIWDIYRRGPLR